MSRHLAQLFPVARLSDGLEVRQRRLEGAAASANGQ